MPSSRIYEPGTNVLDTTWHTPTGWAIVRDALTIGPTRRKDEITPHTRAPAEEDAHHLLVRTVVDDPVYLQLPFITSTNFKKERTATITAAKDLYGSTGSEATAVAAAWNSVGVN